MVMTPELFKYVFTNLLPEVIVHSQSQDEEQVRDHYDSTFFIITFMFSLLTRTTQEAMTFILGTYLLNSTIFFLTPYRFLGPRMIYTSGVITDANKNASLEELQDNKLRLVCSKLNLKPDDRLLDVGCGWGTLAAYAAKNYKCDVTGITLGKNQTKFGNERIKTNGVTPDKARILCMDYRDIPGGPGHFTKIVSLEMAEVSAAYF
jgi:hypothetical protein